MRKHAVWREMECAGMTLVLPVKANANQCKQLYCGVPPPSFPYITLINPEPHSNQSRTSLASFPYLTAVIPISHHRHSRAGGNPAKTNKHEVQHLLGKHMALLKMLCATRFF